MCKFKAINGQQIRAHHRVADDHDEMRSFRVISSTKVNGSVFFRNIGVLSASVRLVKLSIHVSQNCGQNGHKSSGERKNDAS